MTTHQRTPEDRPRNSSDEGQWALYAEVRFVNGVVGELLKDRGGRWRYRCGRCCGEAVAHGGV